MDANSHRGSSMDEQNKSLMASNSQIRSSMAATTKIDETRRKWSFFEQKQIENALVRVPENFPNRFEIIAAELNKPYQEIKDYYEQLIYDLEAIISGRVAPRNYPTGPIAAKERNLHRQWSRFEQKQIENALARVPESLPNRLEVVAEELNKTHEEIKDYYAQLVEDLEAIESGRWSEDEHW